MFILQNTVRSTPGNSERPLAVCRQCHKTCLVSNNNVTVDLKVENKKDENANPSAGGEFVDDTSWGPLSFLSSVLSPTDPFTPVPHISVLPPSPPMPHQVSLSNNNFWDDAELSATTDTTITPQVTVFICYYIATNFYSGKTGEFIKWYITKITNNLNKCCQIVNVS